MTIRLTLAVTLCIAAIAVGSEERKPLLVRTHIAGDITPGYVTALNDAFIQSTSLTPARADASHFDLHVEILSQRLESGNYAVVWIILRPIFTDAGTMLFMAHEGSLLVVVDKLSQTIPMLLDHVITKGG